MQRRKILLLALIVAIAILAGYVYVYEASPFADDWNRFLIAAADPLTALLGAVALTGVVLYYRREDKPFSVWLYFTLGMWVWVLAESVWSYINFTTNQLPAIGLPDALWVGGYVLMGAALHGQYQIVFQTKIARWKVAAIWGGVLAVTLLVLIIVHSPIDLENFVNYLYPVLDFGLCLASVRLFMTFGAGKLSRPWIGLFVMGISDAVYAWLNATGQYQASSDAGTWLSVFTDSSYVAAYLILAIGFLMQYLLLRIGPED